MSLLFRHKFEPHTYIKDMSYLPIFKSVNRSFYFKSRLLSMVLVFAGLTVLASQVVIPLVSFETQDSVSKPASGSVLGLASGYNDFSFPELAKAGKTQLADANIPEYFYVSIPNLGIDNATVKTNAPDQNPDKYLEHYTGSSVPGLPGNVFVYGHSVLPIFYNPRNYKTIFSTLGDLQTGDKIIVNYNNIEYSYKVESKEITDPNNINPLSEFKPKYLNESTLELMTCWPAGTRSKRLLVKAVSY